MASNGELESLRALVTKLGEKVATLENIQVAERGLATSINTGDTAWMLVSTALVIFMTIPGLALFFAGMVRSKNVLATIMQVFSIVCLITFLWMCFGYSLAFAPAEQGSGIDKSSEVYGDATRFWLVGLDLDSVHHLAPNIPESVFCTYQLAFAIITPCLIVGSFADRMAYVPMLIFMALWHLLVYCPIAHSMWHQGGFLKDAGILDYAGGNVVHISSGISGLVSTIILGNRRGFGEESFDPHNILLTCVGAAMLWVGWFGFNAGSAFAADEHAGMAMLCTQISTGVAAAMWMLSEWWVRGQPSVLGLVNGAIAGMVAITPAAGYVDCTGAFFIGFLTGPACYFGSHLKDYFGYDDALDSFGIHAIGGIMGGLLTGFFATDTIAGSNNFGSINGVFYGSTDVGGTQLGRQIYGIVVSMGWSAFMSFILLMAIDLTIGLRVTEEQEDAGLDKSIFGETMDKATNEEDFERSTHGTLRLNKRVVNKSHRNDMDEEGHGVSMSSTHTGANGYGAERANNLQQKGIEALNTAEDNA